jgi:hypothetical protein
MENVVKNNILRFVLFAILLTLITAIIAAVIGLILGWKTPVQFSDGIFFAGVILMAIGFMNLIGMRNQDNNDRRLEYSSALHSDPAEKSKLRLADMARGYNLLALLGTSGLLLFGIAALVVKLF